MAKYFTGLVISFFLIFIANVVWIVETGAIAVVNGMQYFIHGKTFFQSIATSQYLKWILLIDALWIISFFIYSLSRRGYRAEDSRYFLQFYPMEDPKICVIIPAYNEESTIEQVVSDHRKHKFVSHVVVVDNHSSDKTVERAKKCGAMVITKDENRGYPHSIVIGLKEALKTDANLIALTEADGTLSAYDIDKMLPYLDHCEVVNGSRQVQILTEKGNLRESAIHIWGNYFLSKLIQIKYLNWTHLGILNINDQGCMLRIFRREVIEKIESELNYPGTDIPIGGVSFTVFLTMKCLEKDFRIIEVPITYKKRRGESKIGSEKIIRNLIGGLNVLWIILKY